MQTNPIMRKGLAVGIILLFVGIGIIPTSAQNREKSSQQQLRGHWLYVGGSGPGNYTRIQDAINASSDGDTVFVYSGLYYENIVIPKSIRLIGESKNTTIIEANISYYGFLIFLESSNITISGFTLGFYVNTTYYNIIICDDFGNRQNITISNNILRGNNSNGIVLFQCDFCTIAQNNFYLNYGDSISLYFSKNCVITNNLIKKSQNLTGGIYLNDISNSTVSNNSIMATSSGLMLNGGYNNIISNNYFYNTGVAIWGDGSHNNSILSNYIDNPVWTNWYSSEVFGIRMQSNYYDIVKGNTISHCMFGIFLEGSFNNVISMNTFMKNKVHARFYNNGFFSRNIWDQNYWGRPRVLPKPIFGIKDIYHRYPGFIEFDWHPAQKPYDI